MYACFSLGSFPGTFFNNILGPTYIKNKMKLNLVLTNIFILFFILIFISTIYFFNKVYYENSLLESEYFGLTISLSLIGSFIMVKALYERQKMIFEKIVPLENIFYTDILGGISIIFILPLFNYLGGNVLVSFSYLAGSIVSLIFYNILKLQK